MNDIWLLVPTLKEAEQLKVVIEEWDNPDVFSRSICTALIRGHETPESVASYIGSNVNDVMNAKRRICGILYDSSTNRLWLK